MLVHNAVYASATHDHITDLVKMAVFTAVFVIIKFSMNQTINQLEKIMRQVCFLFHSCWLYSSCLFSSGYLTSKTWNVSPEPPNRLFPLAKKEDKALTWAGVFVPVQCPVHATAANCSPWTSGQTQVTAHVVGTRARVTCCTQRNKTGLGVTAVHANM